jgi:hypothetical protein
MMEYVARNQGAGHVCPAPFLGIYHLGVIGVPHYFSESVQLMANLPPLFLGWLLSPLNQLFFFFVKSHNIFCGAKATSKALTVSETEYNFYDCLVFG